jgi:hypothetical protein
VVSGKGEQEQGGSANSTKPTGKLQNTHVNTLAIAVHRRHPLRPTAFASCHRSTQRCGKVRGSSGDGVRLLKGLQRERRASIEGSTPRASRFRTEEGDALVQSERESGVEDDGRQVRGIGTVCWFDSGGGR